MPCGAKTDQVVMCMLVHSHGPSYDISTFLALYGVVKCGDNDYKQEMKNFFSFTFDPNLYFFIPWT